MGGYALVDQTNIQPIFYALLGENTTTESARRHFKAKHKSDLLQYNPHLEC